MNELLAPNLPTKDDSAFSRWTCKEGMDGSNSYKVERLDCESGFSLIRSKISSAKGYSEICSHDGMERMLVIAFGLGGQSEFQDHKGERLSFTTNHTTVSIFQEGEGKRIYAAEPVQQLRLMVSESALVRYIGEERCRQLLGTALAHNESFRQLACGNSGPSEHLRYFKSPTVLQQDGLSQRIHALSLLSEQLQILAPGATSSEQLNTKDIDKLEHVEAYLHAHLDKPLNNAYLCAALGISEYRLKECFRQAYGTSPAQHLWEIRMHRAREMLAAGYQVAETAYRVGYQYPGNFSAAFLRFFGYAPKSVRGKRS